MTIFAKGGKEYRPHFFLPRCPREVRSHREAADRVMNAIVWLGCNRPEVYLTDRELARFLGFSRRYVQKGLKWLEQIGWIARSVVRKVTSKGVEFVRQIKVLITAAGSGDKSKPRKKPGQISLPHASAQGRGIQAPQGAENSSFEESYKQKQQAPGGGESDGTDPPPGSGSEDPDSEAAPDPEAEALAAADPMAVMRAAAELAAASGSTPAQEASAAPRPIVRPSERLRARDADWRVRTERLAAAGDRAAIAELATLPPEPETSSPAVDSPEVESTPDGSV